MDSKRRTVGLLEGDLEAELLYNKSVTTVKQDGPEWGMGLILADGALLRWNLSVHI